MTTKGKQAETTVFACIQSFLFAVLSIAALLPVGQNAAAGQTAESASAPATRPAPLSAAEIGELVKLLADSSFNVREKAQADLIKAGRQVIPKLNARQTTDDEELEQRIKFIIAEIFRLEVAKNSIEIAKNVLWQSPIKGGCSIAATIMGDKLYVFGRDGQLVAIDVKTGNQLWTKAGMGTDKAGIAAVADGVICISDRNKCIYAVKADTGEKVWDFDKSQSAALPAATQPETQSQPAKPVLPVNPAADIDRIRRAFPGLGLPAFAEGLVLVSDNAEKVLAIDAQSGRLKWECPISAGPFGRPVVAGSIAAWSCVDGSLVAVDVKTGKVAWTQEKKLVEVIASGDVIYCRDAGAGKITAIKPASGEQLWETDISAYSKSAPFNVDTNSLRNFLHRGVIAATMIAMDGIIYAISGDGVIEIDAKKGNVVRQCKFDLQALLENKPSAPPGENIPIIGSGTFNSGLRDLMVRLVGIRSKQAILFVQNRVEAVDLKAGAVVWRAKIGGIALQPLLKDDVLYISYEYAPNNRAANSGVEGGVIALKVKFASEQK